MARSSLIGSTKSSLIFRFLVAMIASAGIVLSDELIRTWIYRSHLLDSPIAAVFKQAYNSVPNNEAIRGFIEENLSSFSSSGIFIEPHWVQLVLSLTIAFVIFFLDIMTIHSLSKKIKSGELLKKNHLRLYPNTYILNSQAVKNTSLLR